jgi:hypothetical protein
MLVNYLQNLVSAFITVYKRAEGRYSNTMSFRSYVWKNLSCNFQTSSSSSFAKNCCPDLRGGAADNKVKTRLSLIDWRVRKSRQWRTNQKSKKHNRTRTHVTLTNRNKEEHDARLLGESSKVFRLRKTQPAQSVTR